MLSTFCDPFNAFNCKGRQLGTNIMRLTDRIIHAVLYEVIALLCLALILPLLLNVGVQKSLLLGVFFSVVAMIWNIVFNTVFDWGLLAVKGETRKSVRVRMLHAVLFEATFVGLTLPVVMFAMGITLYGALKLEAAVLVFVLVYTFFFNLVYDGLRDRFAD